ncbi:MAG: hypothetical protein KKA42_10975 [candidate division Zixibacteria bacterium]|nr:hypothetical protein [candidate division Zixibacteria bacterium]
MKQTILRSALLYSGALIMLGLLGYFATGRQSVTALIPAFFGLVVFGVMAITGRVSRPTVSAWVLTGLAVVGVIATITGVPKVVTLISGGDIARPAAAISQTVMAAVSIVFGAFGLRLIRSSRNSTADALAG